MSAAFQLLPPEPKRDRRLDFEFGAESDSNDALISHYGMGTRSYNRSGAKREMDRRCEAAKLLHANDPKEEYLAPLLCACPQRFYPHELAVHQLVRPESYNPRLRFRYPWSLCLSGRVEPSTEKAE